MVIVSQQEMKNKVLELTLKDYPAHKIAESLNIQKYQVLLYQQQIIEGYEAPVNRTSVAKIRMIEDKLFALLGKLNPSVVDVELNKEIDELTHKYCTLCI